MIGNFKAVPLNKLHEILANPKTIGDILYDDESDAAATLDIDKAWHGVHFLLTGTAWETTGNEAMTILGGLPVGDVDVGNGPARYLMPAQVNAIATTLAGIDPESLRNRYDPTAMTRLGIYPQIWDRGDIEDIDYLVGYYQKLRSFYSDTASKGSAMLLWLG